MEGRQDLRVGCLFLLATLRWPKCEYKGERDFRARGLSTRSYACINTVVAQVFFLFTLFNSSPESHSISSDDLQQVLHDSMQENGVIFDEEQIQQLVHVIMEDCRSAGRRRREKKEAVAEGITYTDMRALMAKEKGLAGAIAARCVGFNNCLYVCMK